MIAYVIAIIFTNHTKMVFRHIADYKQLACIQVIDFFRVIDLELEINQFSKYDGLNFEICQHKYQYNIQHILRF